MPTNPNTSQGDMNTDKYLWDLLICFTLKNLKKNEVGSFANCIWDVAGVGCLYIDWDFNYCTFFLVCAGFHCKDVMIYAAFIEKKMDFSVQKLAIKIFQVWTGNWKRSSSKGDDFMKVRFYEGSKKITFQPCLTTDIESRGRSRSCSW